PQHVRLIEHGTALRFDTDYKLGNLPQPVVTKQPDRPPMDKLEIARVEASGWRNQVIVKWNLPRSSPPQIAYRIEVFGGRTAEGRPLKVDEDYAPHVTVKRLDSGGRPGSVRLTVTDIFDQQTSVVVPVAPIVPSAAGAAAKVRPGLRYAYYEAPEGAKWDRLPEPAALEPVRRGGVNGLDVSIQKGGKRPYAVRFAGYLRVPAGGLYAFSLKSLDGSRLKIGGEVIGDNDGLHSRSEKQYAAALAEGLHGFELLHFRGSSNLSIGQLAVLWEGPGIERRTLGAGDLFREVPADAPSITLTPARGVDGPEDNLVEIRPKIDRRGHALGRVEYYCGKLLLNTVSEEPFLFRKVLPEGRNRVMARLWYDDGSSVDSNVLELEVRNVTGPWRFERSGEKGLPLGFRGKEDRVSFVGEGSGAAYQTVSGDFTLTARLADISLAKETGTNKLNWLGLYMTGPEVRLVRTAGVGMRGRKDYRDLAGTNMSIPRYTEGRWLRLVRRGRRSQSFTSLSGKLWTKTEEIVGGPSKDARVGFVFQVIPRAGEGVFHGLLDHVTLERGRVPEEVRRKPRREDLDLRERVTAVVQARDDPEVLYARSTSRGLLKSTDRGRRWGEVNAGLTSPDALAVRSVAVQPGDGSLVLRGGGGLVGGKLRSGLWKSTDGGNSWRLVTRDIDFDGRGPTTIFGETIVFDAGDPKVVAAGGETTGLFVSRDAGETWKHAGFEGERITCLRFRVAGRKRETGLAVGTFADSEFDTLGLGRPELPSAGAPGRVYRCARLGTDPKVSFDLGDPVGVTRIGRYYFTTTRGVYFQDRYAGLRQPLYRLPGDELYTAVGSGAGGTYAAPFSGEPDRVFCAGNRFLWAVLADAEEWKRIASWLKAGAPQEVPTMWSGYECRRPGSDEFLAPGLDAGGISCVLPDSKEEDTLFVCNRDGILKSTDRGKSYKLVYGCSPGR
ncbi:MAG: PA14 domain-containing protein, partial [Planctomycetota bacterium]